MTSTKPLSNSFARFAKYILLGLISFPIIAIILLFIVLNGDTNLVLRQLNINLNFLLAFSFAAGIVSGVMVQQAKASWVELLVVGALCAFVTVVIFRVGSPLDDYAPSGIASAVLAIPVAVLLSGAALLPRAILRVLHKGA